MPTSNILPAIFALGLEKSNIGPERGIYAVHGPKISADKESERGELFRAVRSFIRKCSPDDIKNIFESASSQKLLPIVYDVLSRGSGEMSEEARGALSGYRRAAISQIALQAGRGEALEGLFRGLCARGLHPLVFKGYALRQLYPIPDERISGDEDILIPEAEFAYAISALEALGMKHLTSEDDTDGAHEVTFVGLECSLRVELHRTLFPEDDEAYGSFNRYFDGIYDREAREIGTSGIYMPAPTDHFLMLILHALKHFLHSGFGIRQVADIAIFYREYRDEIDASYVRRVLYETRAEKFTASVMAIAERHLGIDVGGAMPDIEVDEMHMLRDLLDAGIYGSSDGARLHSSTMTLNAVADDRRGKRRGRLSLALQSAFPSLKKLKGRYKYLEKHPIFLPVAWLSRLIHYRRETRRGDGNTATEAIRLGQSRIEMLREYGIID